MKKQLLILLVLLATPYFSISAEPRAQWDKLMDSAHQFTWYPRENLLDLFEKYTTETGMGLTAYCDVLTQALTAGKSQGGLIAPVDLAPDRPWRDYYRLALGQFCLFLAGDNPLHLANARTVMTALIEKAALPEIGFWDCLFRAYTDLVRQNRDGFIATVFAIWRDIVLKREAVSMLTETPFSADTAYLYENLAAVIIRKGVIDYDLSDLHPLSVIVLDLRRKLTLGAGYKRFVEAVVERMTGLKSDNYNLNFAVFFVEAASAHHDFEDAENRKDLEIAWESALTYQEKAEKSAKTDKGRAAIITLKTGFAHFALQRLADGNGEMIASDRFDDLPDIARIYADQSLAWYEALAAPNGGDGRFSEKGFTHQADYIKALHQMWDAAAKLQLAVSAYHNKLNYQNIQLKAELVELPLLKYLWIFEKFAATDVPIVPDNAFFLAAYSAGELAHLYREAAAHSTAISINDFALARQMQAIEIYPFDVAGILQLANQALMENRLNFYLKYGCGVANAMRQLGDRKSGFTYPRLQTRFLPKPPKFAEVPMLLETVIPDLIVLAPAIVPFLKHQRESGEPLIRKALIMSALLKRMQHDRTPEITEGILSALARRSFSAENTQALLREALPEDLYRAAETIAAHDWAPAIANLNYTLYGALEHELHALIRQLFYAVPLEKRHYPQLIGQGSFKGPIFGR